MIQLRIHTTSKIDKNTRGFLRSSKEISTVMIISREFLRVMIVLEGPKAKIKIVVSNHNLK